MRHQPILLAFTLRWRSTFLCLSLLLLSCELSTAQDSTYVTLDVTNSKLEDVFLKIEAQTGVVFTYSPTLLDGDQLISIKLRRATLQTAMHKILTGKGVDWEIHNKSVVIKKKPTAKHSSSQIGSADSIPTTTITGVVIDKADRQPLSGATIMKKGSSILAISGSDGSFLLTNINTNAILVVSNIGYEKKEVRVKEINPVIILMDKKIINLKNVEVVSTGYQDIPKDRATGSFSQVNNEAFNRRVSANIIDRLVDLVPGLNFVSPSGIGNSIDRVQIRGLSTINANTNPLVIVDNFIYEGNINQINPNDVESITILKDAAAASIWGVRAGNGVIVIKLKKGTKQKPLQISLNTNFTYVPKLDMHHIQSIPSRDIISLEKKRFADGFYNSQLNNPRSFAVRSQVVEILNQQRLGLITEQEANNAIKVYENADIRTEIEKYLLQSQITQQYALNLAGGGDKSQYYASLGYDKSREPYINNYQNRITIRTNNTWNPVKNLSINTEVNYAISKSVVKNTIRNGTPILTNPYTKLADEQGKHLAVPFKYRISYIDTVSFPGLLDWHYIPLDEAGNANIKITDNDIRLTGSIQYDFFKHFRISVYYQYQKNLQESKSISSLSTFEARDYINRFTTIDANSGLVINPIPIGGIHGYNSVTLNSWNVRAQLDFNKNTSKNGINGLLGIESRETNLEAYTAAAQFGYNENTQTFQNIIYGQWQERPSQNYTTLNPSIATSRGTINRFGSVYGNISYSYKSRYIVSASGRIDQSNFFGVKTNDRFVPLWSTGLSWNISNEDFYKSKVIPHLAIRATIGYSGNINAGATPFSTARYQAPIFPLFTPYASIETSPNPSLKWEKIKHTNLGIDFSLIKNTLSGSIEAYKKNCIDLISQIQSSPTSGFTTYIGNNASLVTKGIDVKLTSNTPIGNIKLINHFIFSYNTNRVTSYAVPPPVSSVLPANLSGSLIPLVGKPLDKLYTYNWGGLDSQNGSSLLYLGGRLVSSSQSRNALIDDLIYLGRTTPSVFGGFRSEIIWSDFAISIGIRYMFDYKFKRTSFDGLSRASTFGHKDYLLAWKAPGDEKHTNVPAFANTYSDDRYFVYQNSNYLIEKGDHIRLQDFKIDYTIDRLLKLISTSTRGRIYIYINNIGVLWKRSKYDVINQNTLSVKTTNPSLAWGININF